MKIELYFGGLALLLLGIGIGVAIMVTEDYQWWKSRKNRHDIFRNNNRNCGDGSVDA
jgi:hypothetical protein